LLTWEAAAWIILPPYLVSISEVNDMAQMWFVQRGGREHGPFSSEDLRKGKTNGKISRNDLIRNASDNEHTLASELSWLFPYDVYAPAPSHVAEAPHAFLDEYRDVYRQALVAIDTEVPNLVNSGREYQAIRLVESASTVIVAIWKQLLSVYLDMHEHQPMLKLLGSKRFDQLGYELPILSRSTELTEIIGNDGYFPDMEIARRLEGMVSH
jgi:hypothetical protein